MKREKISEAFGNISSRHIEEAIEWYKKAARQDDANALRKLRELGVW